MKFDIARTIRTTKSVITANSPVLLVGTAIAGVVATGILAAKGGYKARGVIDTAELEKGEELTLPEKIQLTWLCYAVPAVTGASAIAAVVGVHTIHTKRAHAMAALYAVASTKLDDVQEKAEELLGAKKTQELNNAVGQKAIDRAAPNDDDVIITNGGDVLCFDEWSGRLFTSSLPMIEKAVACANGEMARFGEVSLNFIYDELELPNITSGDAGWQDLENKKDVVHVKFSTIQTSKGRPAISFRFSKAPQFFVGRS